MSIGYILLAVASILVLLGVGQRVLDKMQLTDRGALVIIATIFVGGLLPNVELGQVSLNIGGAVVPLGVSVYLLIRTDTSREFWRAVIGSLITAGLVFARWRTCWGVPAGRRSSAA